MKRWIWATGILAAVLIAALIVGVIVQHEKLKGPPGGDGTVEGTIRDLSPKISARVTQRLFEKGATVKAGDLLVELDCDTPAAQLAQAEGQLGTAEAQTVAAVAQAEAARSGGRATEANAQALSAQLRALIVQRDEAERQAARVDALGTYATVASQDQTDSAAKGLEYQVSATRSQRTAAVQQAASAEAQAAAAIASAEAAQQAGDAGKAVVTLAQINAKECHIYAPSDGFIEDIYFEVGELAMAGAAVLRLVDLNEVKVVFYLPNNELAAYTKGRDADIVADAWPGIVFHGRVSSVTAKAEFTPRNIQTRTDRDRLVYPVEVKVPNSKHLLRPGMPVQVTLPEAGHGGRGGKG